MKKQFIAKLLALALVLSMVPVAVIGASAAGSNGGYYDVYEDTTPVSTTEVDASDVAVENGSATSRRRSWAARPPSWCPRRLWRLWPSRLPATSWC